MRRRRPVHPQGPPGPPEPGAHVLLRRLPTGQPQVPADAAPHRGAAEERVPLHDLQHRGINSSITLRPRRVGAFRRSKLNLLPVVSPKFTHTRAQFQFERAPCRHLTPFSNIKTKREAREERVRVWRAATGQSKDTSGRRASIGGRSSHPKSVRPMNPF